ncbi:MAG: SPOR domain-containing protein [Nitrospirae bacterium]|nr:SPOR domain-containing protein [Nitrospirota bacterium]
MRGGVTERSSILLLGRNTVVIGAVLITIASFGIGYFFGFRGSGTSEQEKPGVQSAKTSETVPLEEKRVIDLPVKDITGKGAPSAVATAKEAEPDAGADAEKQPEAAAESPKTKAKNETAPPVTQKAAADQNQKTKKVESKTAPAAANQAQADASAQSEQSAQADKTEAAPSKNGKHAAGKAKKKVKAVSPPTGKLYAVQIGAFPNKEGAEQLFQTLKSNGYSPYIINASEDNAYYKVRIGAFKNKKDAEKSAAEIVKKTGLQNFITAAQ